MTAMALTIHGVFSATELRAGRATHLVLTDGRTVPYAETLERARRLASVLAGAGIGGGDRVAIFMRNSRELFETYIACGLAGAIAVPVNGLNTARENGLFDDEITPVVIPPASGGDRTSAAWLLCSFSLAMISFPIE